MAAKTNARELIGLEIQEASAEMANRSVLLNDLEARVKIVQGDIKEADQLFEAASFDVVTSNPPYSHRMPFGNHMNVCKPQGCYRSR